MKWICACNFIQVRVLKKHWLLNFTKTNLYILLCDRVPLKDKYLNFEVGLKCILFVFPYLLLCSYINEYVM